MGKYELSLSFERFFFINCCVYLFLDGVVIVGPSFAQYFLVIPHYL